ncbi:MAG TPA: DsbA family protein [Steroidobacteraceae bacterium]|nr:DsbA family protein [Steroidobacteraceae bacterium]
MLTITFENLDSCDEDEAVVTAPTPSCNRFRVISGVFFSSPPCIEHTELLFNGWDVMQHSQHFRLTLEVNATDHVLGPAHAPVTVVEYGDFECPNCKQAAPAVKLILAKFDQAVRFVYRHFPLEEVHSHALHAAQAAECAGGQGKFWQMHDLLFDNQAHLKLKQLRSYAERLELDLPRFSAEMSDEIYLQRVREHQRSGNDSGVRSTPAFYVNGAIHDVSFGLRSLIDRIQEELRSQAHRT